MKQQQHFALCNLHLRARTDVQRCGADATYFHTLCDGGGHKGNASSTSRATTCGCRGLNDAAADRQAQGPVHVCQRRPPQRGAVYSRLVRLSCGNEPFWGYSRNELSEYAARIVAVEGQLTNITSLQQKTGYLYNKTRQGSITSSLIEIISAMNAMESNVAKGVKRNRFWEKPQRATTISSAKDAVADA